VSAPNLLKTNRPFIRTSIYAPFTVSTWLSGPCKQMSTLAAIRRAANAKATLLAVQALEQLNDRFSVLLPSPRAAPVVREQYLRNTWPARAGDDTRMFMWVAPPILSTHTFDYGQLFVKLKLSMVENVVAILKLNRYTWPV
jgi:hypothetical protein